MKKIVTLMIVGLCFVLVGCGNKTLKAGTYTATTIDNYGGQENTVSAKVVINEEGKIESVYLDTTYTADGKETTKKTLGNEYGMLNHPYGSTVGEWYQQVEKLEEAIVEHQGTDFLALGEDGKTDAVSGCTIDISALVEATNKALEQAK